MNSVFKLLSYSIVGIFSISLLFNNTFGQSSEISVTVKIVDVEQYTGQTWNINAQLRDKINDSEIARDNTNFTVTPDQTIQLIIPLSNSTENLNNSYILVDAASTLDDIDVFGTIEAPTNEDNSITLNLTKSS
ncbi:MAG: hypothetical protein R3321_06765 [Nitrososphaeraceae archaeon]|nr:hypothetical protein [Nitrososphaeraceae archaeon]